MRWTARAVAGQRSLSMLYCTPSPALPCPALPCPALPCPALPCPALPCPALPCPALPCPPLPCPALPCPALFGASGAHTCWRIVVNRGCALVQAARLQAGLLQAMLGLNALHELGGGWRDGAPACESFLSQGYRLLSDCHLLTMQHSAWPRACIATLERFASEQAAGGTCIGWTWSVELSS